MSGEGFTASDPGPRAGAVSEIVAGLAGPEADRFYWKTRARSRIYCLREDGAVFGLLPHEEREIEVLVAALSGTVA